MQISPSANLFRALGGLAQAPAAVNPPRPAAPESAPAAQFRPAAAPQPARVAAHPAPQPPANLPPGNLPRGSLLNIKV